MKKRILILSIVMFLLGAALLGGALVASGPARELYSLLDAARTWIEEQSDIQAKDDAVESTPDEWETAASTSSDSLNPAMAPKEDLVALSQLLAASDADLNESTEDVAWHYYSLLAFLDAYHGKSAASCQFREAVSSIYEAKEYWPGLTYLYALERLIAEIPREFAQTTAYAQYRADNPQTELLIRTRLWASVSPMFTTGMSQRYTTCVLATSIYQWLDDEYIRVANEIRQRQEEQLRQEQFTQNLEVVRERIREEQRIAFEERERQKQIVREQRERLAADYNRRVARDQYERESWAYRTEPQMPSGTPLKDRVRTVSSGGRTGYTGSSSGGGGSRPVSTPSISSGGGSSSSRTSYTTTTTYTYSYR